MILDRLDLEEFRSYRRLTLALDPRGLRLSGRNAAGKSTLLDAVAMLATTRPPRGVAERGLINWASGKDVHYPPFCRLEGTIQSADGVHEIEMSLQADPERPNVAKKQIKLNGRPVRAMDAVGRLKAVLFSPEDVTLISGPPAERRRYVDVTLSQLDGGYLRALSQYGRVLGQRNSLLKSLSRDGVPARSVVAAEQLSFWDDELVRSGTAIMARRFQVLATLGRLASARYEWLTGGTPLQLAYHPSFGASSLRGDMAAAPEQEVKLVVARDFSDALDLARSDEVRRGMTVAGPHRDDLLFTSDGVDLAAYGSRGQQRLAVVALKVAEADLMKLVAGESPVLLLDDVLSELDAIHRDQLLDVVSGAGAQVLITSTDESLLEHPGIGSLPHATVVDGTIA